MLLAVRRAAQSSGTALLLAVMSGGCSSAESAIAGDSAERKAALPKVAFPTSVVHELPATSGRRYQVWVDLPASYRSSTKKLPVVFVTDPNFAFAITRNIRDFTGQRGQNIEEFILVGLVHDPDIAPRESRSRDYTPTVPARGAPGPNTYSAKAYGEAEAYRDYVETKVFPLIARTYRADMSRKTFIGHSYGSLFGLYAMFTRPGMFQNYVLGSPSLWFDEGAIDRIEQGYAAEHRDLRTNILMVAGSYEQPGPSARHYQNTDLVGAMRRFEARLKSRRYAGLTINSEVADGEDHFTVFHDVASRGLISLLPGKGPYTSG